MLQRKSPLVFAGIVSILIISIAAFFLLKDRDAAEVPQSPEVQNEQNLSAVRNISEDDHILGNPAAPIVFYVYSDFSCPYCKDYHETLTTLMKLYGNDGQFAWVFRHIPYVQLHPEAPMYALASECVAQETGNEGFWKFSDELFEKIDPLIPLGAADLVVIAEEAGATRQNFVTCMRSNELMNKVEEDFNEAVAAGAKGSPYTVVQTADKRSVYQGAQKFRALALALQAAIRSQGITELKSPASSLEGGSSIADQFEALEQDKSTTTETSESILDGITE